MIKMMDFSFFFFFVSVFPAIFPPKKIKSKFLHRDTREKIVFFFFFVKNTHTKSGFWEDDDDDEFDDEFDEFDDDEFDQKRRSDRVLEEGLEKKKKREECSLSFDRRPSISNQGEDEWHHHFCHDESVVDE